MKEIDNKLTQKFDEYPSFGVLKGVKVFVTGTNIAGPFAGCLMAEMGAKVLQAEAPTIACQTRGTSRGARTTATSTPSPSTPPAPPARRSSSSASSGPTSGSRPAVRAPMPSAA